jgi:hypothetical protein
MYVVCMCLQGPAPISRFQLHIVYTPRVLLFSIVANLQALKQTKSKQNKLETYAQLSQ